MTEHTFTAQVLTSGNGGHAVVVPKEIAAAFAVKRVRVVAYVDGAEYHSRIAVYGGRSYLGLRLDLLRQVGKNAGDQVEVTLAEDPTEPEPEPAPATAEPTEPPELLAALADHAAARTAYAALPPSHRREYWAWIGEAKQAETRADRVARTVRRLSD